MSSSSGDLQLLHRAIRYITGVAAASFFTKVHIIGGENVPRDGPIIVTATHHNMMLDPVMLCEYPSPTRSGGTPVETWSSLADSELERRVRAYTFPYQRILNYWSKASLFANPVVSWILYSSGNIPVDRKSKDRKVLLKGTMEALAKGYAVALFPEGTSYTEPRIMQIKDGAAWAALEYSKLVLEDPAKKLRPVTVVPAAIVYTNKTKYRSDVVVDSRRTWKGEPRAAVKRLSRAIEAQLLETTINGPDWNTLYAARMARDLMWANEKSINLDEFVPISQTLVDLFSTPDPTPNFKSVRRRLLEYYSLLQSTNLTNSVLAKLPLPKTLDPNRATPLPSRLLTLLILLRDTFIMLFRLPFFAFPLFMYLPVYYMGRLGARLVQDEEETQAQNKLVFGMLSMFLTYPFAFFFLWAFFTWTRVGAVLAAATLWLFAKYHDTMINGKFPLLLSFTLANLSFSSKLRTRLLATWRVLVGVWGPKRWDLSISALTPYITPVFPKESEYISKKPVVPEPPNLSNIEPPAQLSTGDLTNGKGDGNGKGKRRPPSSRRIMRHVLRARGEAVKALAEFFEELRIQSSQSRNRGGMRVSASLHLARMYGGVTSEEGAEEEVGWREASEVIAFLTKRGAKIPQLAPGRLLGIETEADWAAALSSDAEFEPGTPGA
ncbi:PlsC domain-containing protein [Mycena kentingensis (nom. inval.)]|nr:PlsC domain-containing protein [Mycena kentingensis (nom. inval.)]